MYLSIGNPERGRRMFTMWFRSGLSCGIGLFILFISTTISLSSCRSEKEKVPDNLLPPERMREILWDLIRADMYVKDHISDSMKADRNIAFYKEIFQIHKTSQEQFRESYLYYKAHPGEMKSMLDSLEKRSLVQVPKEVRPGDTARKLPKFRKTDIQ